MCSFFSLEGLFLKLLLSIEGLSRKLQAEEEKFF
jgi:hypothetical protein